MGSLLSMLWPWQDTDIISVNDVFQQLQRSSTFSWCIYRKRDIIRHVGIIIMFDGKPFCTVDFTVENRSLACLVDCPSKVLIGKVSPGFQNSVDCGNVIQCIDTTRASRRQDAQGIINNLVAPNQEYYSLLFNNCRHNTKDVIKRVCSSARCYNLEETRRLLLQTQCEDNLLMVLVILSLAGALKIRLPQVLSRP